MRGIIPCLRERWQFPVAFFFFCGFYPNGIIKNMTQLLQIVERIFCAIPTQRASPLAFGIKLSVWAVMARRLVDVKADFIRLYHFLKCFHFLFSHGFSCNKSIKLILVSISYFFCSKSSKSCFKCLRYSLR